MKKLLFIINPVTAKAALTPSLIDILDTFGRAGYAVTTHVTRYKHDTQDTVRAIGSQFATIVCAGGDGPLNETVSGPHRRQRLLRAALCLRRGVRRVHRGILRDAAAHEAEPRMVRVHL